MARFGAGGGILMPRRRMIDPSIWSDSLVGSLSDPARILFIALISNADDEGRLEADALSLRRTAFGFRDVTVAEVEGWLVEIASTLRSVAVYQCDGRRYVELQNWLSYQTINRPTPSRIPAFRNEDSVTLQVPLTEGSLNAHGGLSESSLLREGKRREEKGREGSETRARTATPERRREIPEGTSDLYDAVLAAMMLDHNCSQRAWRGVQEVVANYAAAGRTPDFVRRQAEWFRTEHWIGKRGEPPSAANLIDSALHFAALGNGSKPKPKPPPVLTPEQIAKRDRALHERQRLAAEQMERLKGKVTQ